MATLRDIAKQAGVSVTTASDVLNGRTLGVRRDAAERAVHIRSVAERLGYRRNSAARVTRTGRFGSAALLLPPPESNSAYIGFGLWFGIQEELARHDMHASVARLPGADCKGLDDLPKVVREKLVDGLLINYTHHIPAAFRKALRRFSIPTIWINTDDPVDSVAPDDAAAGAMAMRHLLACGTRRPGYLRLGGTGHVSEAARLGACRAVAAEAGLTVDAHEVPLPRYGPGARTAGQDPRLDLAMQWLDRPDRPDAVMTYSGWTAQPLLLAAARLGLRVPEDLGIITIEDEAVTAPGQPITTVCLNVEQIGKSAVRMLLQKLDARGESLPTERIPPVLAPGATTRAS